ncbi:hypothetical protein RFI_05656, partial [Reticulomyxa filosa]
LKIQKKKKKKKKERFDYAIEHRPQFGVMSYTGCLKFLRSGSTARENVMNSAINLSGYVNDIATLTSNKEVPEFVKNKEQHASRLISGAFDPRVFHAIHNVLIYRLNDTTGKNFQHGLMSLFLLRHFLKKSTDRFVVTVTNVFFPIIVELTRYKHSNERIEHEFNFILFFF